MRPDPSALKSWPLRALAGFVVLASWQCVSPNEQSPADPLAARSDSLGTSGGSATMSVPQTWTRVPSSTTASLNDVWSGGNVVFAVGDNGTILRSQGQTFVQMPTPTTANLNAVWGANPGNVYATGDGPTVLRLNDGQWLAETVAAPGLAEHGTDIWGSSPTDVYIGTRNRTGGHIRHSGEGWPIVAEFGNELGVTSIHGFGATDIYALLPDFRSGQIAHYDGSSWTRSPIVTEHGVTPSSLWGSAPNDLFVAGFDHDAGMGTVVHFDGTSWSLMTVPPNPQTTLRDLWGSSSSDVYALASGGVLFRYDGTAWSIIETGIEGNYEGIFGTVQGDVYIVGRDGLILRGER